MSVLDDPREATLRHQWGDMLSRRLPQQAQRRDGITCAPDQFARILLDAAAQRPWVGPIVAPEWGNAPLDILEDATALGEAVLEGSANFIALDRLSVQMRKKRGQCA